MTTHNIKTKLMSLRLKTSSQNIDLIHTQVMDKNLSFLQGIERLLDLELEQREQARIKRCFKQSKLTSVQTIDQFDFDHHASRKNQKHVMLNLLSLEFIDKKQDIIMIGNPGVGKTFLAKCIAYAATQSGIKTLFTTTMDLINQLIAAEADRSLLKKLHYYQSPDLLVCDEIGYLPLDAQGSNLFFQVISARHEIKSTIITTNRTFSDWGNVFDNTTVATAIADRLVYNSEILILEGNSYRKRKKS